MRLHVYVHSATTVWIPWWLGGGSALSRSCCSCRGPGFPAAPLWLTAVIPVLEELTTCVASMVWQTHDVLINIQTNTHTRNKNE